MRWLLICLLMLGCSAPAPSTTHFAAVHEQLHQKVIPALSAFYARDLKEEKDVAQRVKAAREFETQLAQIIKDVEESSRALKSLSPLPDGDEYRLVTEELARVVKEEAVASLSYARKLQHDGPLEESQFHEELVQVNHVAALRVECIKKCQNVYDKHFRGSAQLSRPEL